MSLPKPFTRKILAIWLVLVIGLIGFAWFTMRPLYDQITEFLPTFIGTGAIIILLALAIGIPTEFLVKKIRDMGEDTESK